MRVDLELRKGKRVVYTEVEFDIETILDMLKDKIANKLCNEEEVDYYRKEGYYIISIRETQ